MGKSYKILLDTNMILTPFEFSIDLLGEMQRVIPGKIELITLEPVIKELKRKKRGVGLKLVEKLKIEVLPADGRADDAIVKFAEKNKDVIVATNDDALKKRLRDLGVPVIIVRGKQKLDLIGYVGW